jgi:hypothetical protein
MLDMNLDTNNQSRCSHHQLAAVIARLGDPAEDRGYYMSFLRVFGPWIRVNDISVKNIYERKALGDNFQEADDSDPIGTILLYVADIEHDIP